LVKAARVGWFSLAVFTLFLFAAGTLQSFEIGLRLLPETKANLGSAGIPLNLPAYALVIMDAVTLGFFLSIASLLVWRRGDEPGALVVAAMLLCTGGLYTGPTANGSLPYWMLAILPGLAETFQAWFVYLFPDGRPVPRWMWWILFPLPIWRIGIWLVDYVPNYKIIPRTAENYGYTPQAAWDIGLFLVLLALGVVAQIYRYRKISTPTQRQQTKWVLFGAALTLCFVGTYVIVFNVLGYAENAPLIVSLVARMLRQISLMILPATMAIAVLRYRLWDIDFAVNRSLVYGTLTVLLAAMFAISLLVTSRLLGEFTGYPILALGFSGFVFTLIFQPVRRAVQRFVDRNFYHIYIDYQESRSFALPPLDNISFPKTQFTDYTDLELAGRGGMAEVYRATHPTLRRTVAIKMMRERMENVPDQQQLFERESATLRGLEHPNVIRVFDAGEINGRPYLVMEFIEGPVLNHLLEQKGKLDQETTRLVLRGIADALDYLHQQKIVHRDVKPGNVLLDENTNPARPVLTDFGLAKLIGDTSIASQSGVAGTFTYIAPEQIQARKDLDGRADIYAFGVMAFQLLTGDLPFKHENPGALLIAHMLHPAPDAHKKDPGLSIETSLALQKAMAKEPSMRYATASEFVAALGL
jgi:serine/threonine-protein kinase